MYACAYAVTAECSLPASLLVPSCLLPDTVANVHSMAPSGRLSHMPTTGIVTASCVH